jgi:hypothetical protein
MPVGKKIEGTDWIEDPKLLQAFIQRLDDAIDSGVDLDFAWARTVKANALKHKRYSLGQEWALQKLETRIDNLLSDRSYDDGDLFGVGPDYSSYYD